MPIKAGSCLPRLTSCAPKITGGATDVRHQKGGGIVPQMHRFGHPWPNIKRRVAALPARQGLPLSPPAPFPLLGKGERRVAAAKPGSPGPRHGPRPAGRHSSASSTHGIISLCIKPSDCIPAKSLQFGQNRRIGLFLGWQPTTERGYNDGTAGRAGGPRKTADRGSHPRPA